MKAFTICAVNYLPFAATLGNSFLDNNPDSSFSIFVVDGEKLEYKKNQRFDYLDPKSLKIPRDAFVNMTIYYDVTELSTALKPSVFKILFDQGYKEVVYLDPDIQVFSELKELKNALMSDDIVLTPHTLGPMPRDGLRPSESDILESGTFNLGFLGLKLSDNSNKFLDWWEERLQFDAIVDPSQMLFTDQRWIDFVPSYFPAHVIRHPGYNVAYWNLHEREISQLGDEYFSNGSALRFFHFSGYRPDTPWILSKYVANRPRVKISENPLVAKLCGEYGNLAINQGWDLGVSTGYGHDDFENRSKIPSSVRRLYREDCVEAFNRGETLSPPSNWQMWATSRSSESGNLSRILYSLWKSRPDLQKRFPDAIGKNAKDLIKWANQYGISQKVIDADLIEVKNSSPLDDKQIFLNQKGINLIGYLKGELGVGQSGRLVYNSLKSTGLPINPINYTRLKSRQSESFNENSKNVIYPLTIAVINADQMKIAATDFSESIFAKSRVIGLWAWETQDFPKEMHSAFDLVDEIWTVSNFAKAAIECHTKKKVFVFPTPIIAPEKIQKLEKEKLGIPNNRKFNLFIFDYLSVFERKNPLDLIEAHKLAFPDEAGPILVIKSMNFKEDFPNREKLHFAAKNRSDIILLEDYLPREQITALINECSVYVSLHRSEGYGLTLAEAMSLGKPVVATGYSGNLDFMNESVSFLVPYLMARVGDNSPPYASETLWAQPNVEVAAQILRKLFNEHELAENLGSNAKAFVGENFNKEKVSKFLDRRIKKNFSQYKRLEKQAFKFWKKLKLSKKFSKIYLKDLLNIFKS